MPADLTEIDEKVLAFVRQLFPESDVAIDMDTRLEETVGFDSLAAIEIIMFLEQTFSINVEHKDLRCFGAARSIVELIESKT